ncbi:hypothetical protein H8959_013948 [Pygathrix nigripes]
MRKTLLEKLSSFYPYHKDLELQIPYRNVEWGWIPTLTQPPPSVNTTFSEDLKQQSEWPVTPAVGTRSEEQTCDEGCG